MTAEMWIIAAVRLLGALPVLRWPFYGALLAMLVDQSDLFMMNLIDLGGVDDYQTFDKLLDQAYLLTFLVVALGWQGPARTVAVALYAYRMAGFAAFELTEDRDVLLLFPNFFEYWFVLMAGMKEFGREPAGWQTSRMVDGQRVASGDEVRKDGGFSPVRKGPVLLEAPDASEAASTALLRPMSQVAFISIVTLLIVLKLFQEYALHYGRWLDGFTAVEAVEAIWRFLTPPY